MKKINKINELIEQAKKGTKITLEQFRALEERERFDLINTCANELKQEKLEGKRTSIKQLDINDMYLAFSSFRPDTKEFAEWNQAKFQLVWTKEEDTQTLGFTIEEIEELKELLAVKNELLQLMNNKQEQEEEEKQPFTNLDLNHPLMQGESKSIGLHIPEDTLKAWKQYVKSSKLKQKDLLAYALIFFMENNPL